MILRWIIRVTLIVLAFVVGYVLSFLSLFSMNGGVEGQRLVDVFTPLAALSAATLVGFKTRRITKPSSAKDGDTEQDGGTRSAPSGNG